MLVAGTIATVLILAGCSDAGEVDSGAGSGDDGDFRIEGVPTLAELVKGSEGQPPSTSPPPAKGKNVWWISCGQSSQSCAGYARAAEEAGKALGWNFHIADGNLNRASGYSTAIRTALAAKPDAIVLSSFSCDLVRQPLEEAKAQGVLVIGSTTIDCADTGGPKLFTADNMYSEAMKTQPDYWRTIGRTHAQYVMNESRGTAKIIVNFGKGDPQQDFLNNAFLDELKKCSGCQVVDTVTWTTTDLTPNGPWITAFRSSLVRHPEATHVFMPFEQLIGSQGGAQAIRESGRKLVGFGGLGAAEAIDVVRDGNWTAISAARSPEWIQWATIDNLNRALNGQPPVPQGVGFVVIDKDNNMPPQPRTNYQTAVDFKAAYKKAWGVG